MPALRIPTGDIDLAATLRPIALQRHDPTVRLAPGRFERATVTPDGPGSITATWEPAGREAHVATHGPGAEWLLARAPRLLGCDDDPCGFAPAGQPLRDLWRRHRGLRLPRTGTLWHDLAWFIVQQRISGAEAADQWRRLVLAHGPPAPGPASRGQERLRTPPDATTVAALAYHEFHRFGIERRRADHLRLAAQAVGRIERDVDGGADTAVRALRAVRGIGPWTTSYLATQTWGEPDVAIVGDHGIPAMVAWVLAGEREADDARLLELLEPYRPHRSRVIRLAFAHGHPPRRHHRAQRRDIRFI